MNDDFIKFFIESIHLIKSIKNSTLIKIIYDTKIVSNSYFTTLLTCNGDLIFRASNFFSRDVDYIKVKNFILPSNERLVITNYHNFNNLWQIFDCNECLIDINPGRITNYDEFNEQLFLTRTLYSDKISMFICLYKFIFELRIGEINLFLLESYNIDYKKELLYVYELQKELMVNPWIY